MKLQKAIELSEEAVRSLKKGKFPDHAAAVQLGIKALKRVLAQRSLTKGGPIYLLPGETED